MVFAPLSKDGNTWGRWLRAALTLLVALTLAACSVLPRFGYENLPMLAGWRLDHYLDLSAEQKTLARQRLEALQAWHRRTQLADYQDWLQAVQHRLATGPVDEAQLRTWRGEVAARWLPLAEHMAPAVADLARTLTPEQIARLRRALEEDNEKLRKDWLPVDPTERIEVRSKRYLERAERFLGRLTPEQKQLARRMAAEAPDTESIWYAQRLARQQDLLALLERLRRERPDEATATRWVRAHLTDAWMPAGAAQQAGVESSLAAGDEMAAALLARATPKQREHLQRTLQDWIGLLGSLRGAPAGARG